jgi:hypothetical protein
VVAQVGAALAVILTEAAAELAALGLMKALAAVAVAVRVVLEVVKGVASVGCLGRLLLILCLSL